MFQLLNGLLFLLLQDPTAAEEVAKSVETTAVTPATAVEDVAASAPQEPAGGVKTATPDAVPVREKAFSVEDG